jgi:hypothetical protein
MRISVRKHYTLLNSFVGLANLGWNELVQHSSFPLVHELKSVDEHRGLLRRIDRAIASSDSSVRPLAQVPPLFLPEWGRWPRARWREVHAYFLVRRVFDSLEFLSRGSKPPETGMQLTQLSLQIEPAQDRTIVRIHDPYEDFLHALDDKDLSRLKSCPVCGRFFVAWRSDQKSCNLRCANRLRVFKFRQKQPEYLAGRKFRKRTGLKAVRHGRHKIMDLHQAAAICGNRRWHEVGNQPHESTRESSCFLPL